MTQLFTYRGFSLMKAPTHVKLLITLFVATMTTGIGVGFVNYQLRTGLTVAGSRAWYSEGLAKSPAAAGLGADEVAPLQAKTALELLDVSHVHLFNMAFLVFVLGHLLALCAIRPAWKNAVYLCGFAGVLVDVASPWLIRFTSPAFSWLQLGGHALLGFATIALVALPLLEMWGPRGRPGREIPVP